MYNFYLISGRKVMLLSSFAVLTFEMMLLAYFPSLAIVIISKAISGLGDCTMSVAYTIGLSSVEFLSITNHAFLVTDISTINKDLITEKYG